MAYNIRRIDDKGNEFIVFNQSQDQTGTMKAVDLQKVSTINSAGQMKLEEDFRKEFSQSTAMMARVEGDLLIETVSTGKTSESISYLRSSETESIQYFAAQKSCTATSTK
jgi:hypothetical protein